MKKTVKTFISSVLVLIMLLSVIPFTAGAAYNTPFEDVKPTDYFYEPVIWAYGEGITTGTSATKFSPDATCTRGQVVTFLWRAMGKPEPEAKTNPFTDVKESDYYYKPILWAVEKGITTGTDAKHFSPATTCTNAHILTFIWRALGEESKTETGEWYSDAEDWAKNGGLLDGTYTGTFDIKANCPRANVVTYLYKYLESDTLTVYVSADADAKTADGTAEKPFATIEEARDYVRTLDKSKYGGITVRVAEGSYYVAKTIEFTAKDGGTEKCPVRYVGDGEVEITGAVNLKAEDFAPATGKASEWFKEDAKANIVEVDLKKFGYKPEDIAALYKGGGGKRSFDVFGKMPPVTADSEFLTLARFPNDCYATSMPGTTMDFDDSHDEYAGDPTHPVVVCFEEEYADTVRSWHDLGTAYLWARLSYVWLDESTYIYSVEPDEAKMYVSFSGGHMPQEYGMPLFWYNIPEELDYPGEYYVDEDAVMYIYKPENFDEITYALLRTDKLVNVNGANWLSFENLIFENVSDRFFTINADHFNLIDCVGRGSSNQGGEVIGSNNVIDGNEFYNIFDRILVVDGGDEATLTPSNNVITNNYFHDWGKDNVYCSGLGASGIGDYIAHNELTGGSHINVDIHGHNCIFEYNYLHDTMLQADDVGCFASTSGYGAYGNILRYNYLENIGPVDPHFMVGEIDCYFPKCGVAGFYYDFMGCGQTIYGNVFNRIYGDGVMTSGHHNAVTNNLFVACAKYAMEMNTAWYSDITDRGSRGEEPDGFSYVDAITPEWVAQWKELGGLKRTLAESKEDRSDYWAAPTHVTIKDNAVYFDKGYYSKGMNSKMTSYSFESHFYDFPTLNTIELLEHKILSSKRNPYNIEDLVRENEETLGMTLEQFKTIGRRK